MVRKYIVEEAHSKISPPPLPLFVFMKKTAPRRTNIFYLFGATKNEEQNNVRFLSCHIESKNCISNIMHTVRHEELIAQVVEGGPDHNQIANNTEAIFICGSAEENIQLLKNRILQVKSKIKSADYFCYHIRVNEKNELSFVQIPLSQLEKFPYDKKENHQIPCIPYSDVVNGGGMVFLENLRKRREADLAKSQCSFYAASSSSTPSSHRQTATTATEIKFDKEKFAAYLRKKRS